ncbi:MAG: hypothetical protein CEE43_06080 [Promethearchaeota archaeon Loki_b32]|nr:MAG: hypothetical protein CEE43_06080 [Candidatus Lokiarchaeota archaeon Loki_b32]
MLKSFINRISDAEIHVDALIFDEIDIEYEKIYSIEKEIEESSDLIRNDDFLIEELRRQDVNGVITLTHGYSGSDIERGIRVALFKAVGAFPITEKLDFNMLYRSLELVGGTEIHVDRQEILSTPVTSYENLNESDDNLQKLDLDINVKDFDELVNHSSKLIPILSLIKEILEHREGLKNDYLQSSNDEFVNFIKIIKDLSKILKDKNILKD